MSDGLSLELLRRAKQTLDDSPVPIVIQWPPQDGESREALIERRRKDNETIILKMFGIKK